MSDKDERYLHVPTIVPAQADRYLVGVPALRYVPDAWAGSNLAFPLEFPFATLPGTYRCPFVSEQKLHQLLTLVGPTAVAWV